MTARWGGIYGRHMVGRGIEGFSSIALGGLVTMEFHSMPDKCRGIVGFKIATGVVFTNTWFISKANKGRISEGEEKGWIIHTVGEDGWPYWTFGEYYGCSPLQDIGISYIYASIAISELENNRTNTSSTPWSFMWRRKSDFLLIILPHVGHWHRDDSTFFCIMTISIGNNLISKQQLERKNAPLSL